MTTATAAAPPALNPHDFLAVDALLSDEERMIRDTVRAFVQNEVVPNVGEWFEEGILPRELAPKLGELGLLGMHLEGYGCAGASAVAYGLTCLELEAGDSGLRSRARSRCSRSGAGAARIRSRSGCRGWPSARRSAASG